MGWLVDKGNISKYWALPLSVSLYFSSTLQAVSKYLVGKKSKYKIYKGHHSSSDKFLVSSININRLVISSETEGEGVTTKGRDYSGRWFDFLDCTQFLYIFLNKKLNFPSL